MFQFLISGAWVVDIFSASRVTAVPNGLLKLGLVSVDDSCSCWTGLAVQTFKFRTPWTKVPVMVGAPVVPANENFRVSFCRVF
jgi:hypothetical protein